MFKNITLSTRNKIFDSIDHKIPRNLKELSKKTGVNHYSCKSAVQSLIDDKLIEIKYFAGGTGYIRKNECD